VSRFVRPAVRTLVLENGDRLMVRERLTAGEQRAKLHRMYTAAADGQLQVNRLQVGLATVTAYLLDWTITDDAGRLVPIAHLSIPQLETILDSLTPEAFREIREAIETHESAMEAERDAEKKTRTGATPSGSTSSSPDAAAGAMTGSAT
jgi:hypothetical protein